MKTTATKTAKTPEVKYTEREKQTLADISRQLEMALTSDKTPQGVKDCLYTIIFEASNEAGLPLGDISLVQSAFPNIIEALPKDYGRGIYHSIHSILIQDTSAFKDFYEKRLDEKPDKRATETPKMTEEEMTEEEMKKFISVVANNEQIQGDYVHNGFLFFFQSIYEVVKKSPVEAQNLMFHLQQHVFNNLMWESYRAFDAHRNKARSIFSSTEPYIYEEETEEETSDAPKTEAEENNSEFVWDAMDEHHNAIWANKISHVLASENVSKEIKDAVTGIMDAAADEANHLFDRNPEIAKASFPVIMSSLSLGVRRAFVFSIDNILEIMLPENVLEELRQYEKRFESSKTADETESADEAEENQDLNVLANQLSSIMKNDLMPTRLFNVIADELSEVPKDWRTPENVLFNLQGMRKKESDE